MPAKLALLVDVESLHGRLRGLHHRMLDPALLLEAAKAQGKVVRAVAAGDWTTLPPGLRERFAEHEVETVQVDRLPRGRESGGRRRDVLRDLVDMELLAQTVEACLDGGADALIFATGDETCVRAIGLARERFEKDVHVIGVEGAIGEALEEAACSCAPLPMPPAEPQDMEALERLVAMLEGLERKKRYLNYKYIRESVVRKVELPEKSFEAAEVLLSDAIACGLLLKIKVEDKYNAGQFFTAYALDRESALFKELGSGEPAPVHEDAESAPAVPTMSRRKKEPEPERQPAPAPAPPAPREDDKDEDDGAEASEDAKRQRRRRRGKGERVVEEAPLPAQTGSVSKGKKKRRGKTGNSHQQDRVGRSYEPPSRFLSDDSQEEQAFLDDDEIDESMILQARGDG